MCVDGESNAVGEMCTTAKCFRSACPTVMSTRMDGWCRFNEEQVPVGCMKRVSSARPVVVVGDDVGASGRDNAGVSGKLFGNNTGTYPNFSLQLLKNH